jgi:putative flippase GtrA
MAKGLSGIDNAAAEKGKGIETVWQFVKFIFVSLIAMIVQFALLNILNHVPPIVNLFGTDFKWWVFESPVNTVEGAVVIGGLGYFISNNTANIIAQIVSFFVNRKKTFNSNVNVALTLPIYIIFTLALIAFSAWLNPTLQHLFVNKGWMGGDLAANASTMICSAVQFFLYFPFDKILFPKAKEAAVEEAAEAATEE